jgi:hypothetical protein
LAPLFEDEYVEANSNEGYKISKSFQKMKTLIPAEVAGNPGLTRVTQTSSSLPEHEGAQTAAYALFPPTQTTGPEQQTSTRSTIAQPPTFPEIKDKYRQVQAKRDPNDRQALKIATQTGWKTVGDWKSHTEDQRAILYSDQESVWTYVEAVED